MENERASTVARFDFAAWIARARIFAENFSRLPKGEEMTVHVRVGPPATAKEIEAQEVRLGHKLPGIVRDMYLFGSGDFVCSYTWFPPPEISKKLDEIIGVNFVFGGPTFTALGDLVERKRVLLEVAEIWASPGSEPGWDKSSKQCANSLPLVDIGNGDELVLDMSVPSDDPAVLYLCHEEPVIWRISPTFTEFLTEWEKVAYLGPDFGWFRDWVDRSPTGFLCAECYPTQPLYDLLNPAKHPLTPN